jgi:replicative DNA helicase
MLTLAQVDPTKRVSPHSIEAEKACLGAVFIRPDVLDELSVLAVDDFMLPAHREVFAAMRTVRARGQAVDVLMVGDQLKAEGLLSRLDGGAAYLNDLANATPTAENVVHYAKIVSGRAALRRLIAVCADLSSSAYSADIHDVPGFLAEARVKLSGVELPDEDGPVQICDEVSDVLDEMEKRGEHPEEYMVKTGLRAVDSLITGMFPGETVIIAANPSRGKTALALDVLMMAAEQQRVPGLMFSLEMKRRKLIERALVFEGRVNGRKIQRGQLDKVEWDRLVETSIRWNRSRFPVWIDQRMHTASRLCAVARRWRAQRRRERLAAGLSKEQAELAVVAIDYLGLVRSDERNENRRLEVAEMSRQFKTLAKEENLVVLECAQLNRANMKDAEKPREPQLSDLRDAGEIEQDGDTIMFPWWEGKPPMEGAHPAEIIVRKSRNGPTGHAKVLWEREFMTFSNRERQEDEDE